MNYLILYYFTFLLLGCNYNSDQKFLKTINYQTSLKAHKKINQNNINFNSVIEKSLPMVVKIYLLIDEIKIIDNTKYHIQNLLGTGSGFIIDNHKIITNYHVLEEHIENKGIVTKEIKIGEKEFKGLKFKPKILVEFNGGEIFNFNVFNHDLYSDIVLLNPIQNNIKYFDSKFYFANSDNVKIGNLVIAIGSPLNTFNSSSLGIISSNKKYLGHKNKIGKYAEYLQTDASISKGNSGGPLININGQLIGIISNKIVEEKQSNDISYAISSNYVKMIIDQLQSGKQINRNKLNINVHEKNGGLIFSKGKKITVTNINKKDSFGFNINDQILMVNGNKIKNKENLDYYISNQFNQCETYITVVRNNQKINLFSQSKKCN